MAGRGTDINLGGNAEYMAKHEMARQGFTDELIAEATGFGDTDDEDIINARKVFTELNDKFKAQIKPEQDEVRELGGLYITNQDVSTISLEVVQVVRVTPVYLNSSFHLMMIL